MTAKEKAKELYNKMIVDFTIDKWQSKQCALVAVDEIIKAHIHNEGIRHLKWWKEVKQEIESL
jgi:hypothetical protein